MGTQLPHGKGLSSPITFWRMSVVAKRSPISAAAELLSLNSFHLFWSHSSYKNYCQLTTCHQDQLVICRTLLFISCMYACFHYFLRQMNVTMLTMMTCTVVVIRFTRDSYIAKFFSYIVFVLWDTFMATLQCFDTVGWAAGRASGL